MEALIRQIIETYAEGGTIAAAIDAHPHLKRGDFYLALRRNPDLKRLYHEVQTARADMMVDEAYQLSTDNSKNPQLARVQAEIRLKIAAFFDRPRFGDNLALQVEQTVSVAGALQAARARSLRPPTDRSAIKDAQVTDVAALPSPGSTDTQSEGAAIVPDPAIDPFS